MARIKKGEVYRYKTGKYVREEINDMRGCKDYRYVKINKPGRKLLVCITNKKGPRGGRTKAIALLRSLDTAKGRTLAKQAKVKEMKRGRK